MEHDTDADWVTFYRVWHAGLGRELLVQKRDGMTRTVPASARRKVGVVEKLLLGESRAIHADHDLVTLQAA